MERYKNVGACRIAADGARGPEEHQRPHRPPPLRQGGPTQPPPPSVYALPHTLAPRSRFTSAPSSSTATPAPSWPHAQKRREPLSLSPHSPSLHRLLPLLYVSPVVVDRHPCAKVLRPLFTTFLPLPPTPHPLPRPFNRPSFPSCPHRPLPLPTCLHPPLPCHCSRRLVREAAKQP